jgi:hypothetical protein
MIRLCISKVTVDKTSQLKFRNLEQKF